MLSFDDIPDSADYSDEVERFHGNIVLGRVVVDDQAMLSQLRQAIGSSAEGEALPECFFPRHGLHIETGDQIYDLLICFECFHAYVYGKDGKRVSTIWIAGDEVSAYNRIAEDLGIELPKNVSEDSP